MINESELQGFRRDRYFARSWALLTRDRGWIKPVLLMTVALLVPFVGALGVMGYVFEWARLTAWGVNSAPKQKGVRVGECISSGWRVFVVFFVWNLGIALVVGILSSVPLIGSLFTLVWSVLSLCAAVVVSVAAMRATVYQKIVPGLRVPVIWRMVSHDPVGLLRIVGIQVIAGIVIGTVTAIVLLPTLFAVVPSLITMVEYLEYSSVLSSSMQARVAVQAIFSLLASVGPALILLVVLCGFLSVILSLVSVTAVALWMRQFNVPVWGRDEDPLPPFVSDPRDAAQQAASWAYGIPQQPVTPAQPTDPAASPAPAPQPAPASESPAGLAPYSAPAAESGPVAEGPVEGTPFDAPEPEPIDQPSTADEERPGTEE